MDEKFMPEDFYHHIRIMWRDGGFQQSRRIATVGGFAGQGGGPNDQSTPDTADSGGETIKQRTVNIEVNVQSPDAPATGATPENPNPNAANPGMMNPALLNNPQSRFMNNMGPGAGFNPMFNQRQQPGMNPRNSFNGFDRASPVNNNNNNNRNSNRPADDSSSSSSSSGGGGNINIGLGIGVGSSSPVVPPKPASTKTPAPAQFGGGRGMRNAAQNVQPTPPDPFQQQGGMNVFDQSGFQGMTQTGFPPNDPSGFPANAQISFPSNPQTGFPPSNQFQPIANNPPVPTLQRFDQQPPDIAGSMPASNSMPWNTFQSNAGNFGQDTGSLANTNTLINSNQNVFANNMQRSNVNGMQILRNIPQQANGIVQTRFNMMQPQQFNNLASNQNFANSPVLTSQTSPGEIGLAAGFGGFDPTRQNSNLPNSGNVFPEGSFASEPTIGEPMIIDNGGRTTVVVDNITFTGLLPPGPPVLKTQVINGKGSVHINPIVSPDTAANSFGKSFPPQLHFTNPNDMNSINQNILLNANSNQLFQNQNMLGLPGTQGTKSPVEPQMNQDTSFGTPSIFVNTSGLINLTQSAGNAKAAWASNNSTTLVSNATNQPQMIDISIPLNTNPMSAPKSNTLVDTLTVGGGTVSSVDLLATVTTEVPGLLNMVTSHSIGPNGSNLMSAVHPSSAIPHNLMTSTLPSLDVQSISTTVPPQILANDPHLNVVENIPHNPAEVSKVIGNVTLSASSASQTPNNAFQTQILTSSNVLNPAVGFNNPQLLEMQRQQQILQMHRLALLKRREEQLNTLRKQLLQMELKGNQRQPVQRNPLTAKSTKDLRILKNIKPGAKAPQTTATSAVAFMNVDSLRSLIEEVLHGFFKKQRMNPTSLPQPTVSKSSFPSIDAVNTNVLKPARILSKELNLLQLNMSAVQLSTSPTGIPLTTHFNSLPTSTVPPIVTVKTGLEPSVLPTEPTTRTVTDPSATPVTDPNVVPVTDPTIAAVTDPSPVTDPSVATVTTVDPSVVPVTEPSAALVTDPNMAVVTDPSLHAAEAPVNKVTGIQVTDKLSTGVFSTTTLPPSTTYFSLSSSPVIMDSVGNSVGQPSLSGQKRNMFPGGIAVHPELSTFQMAHVRNVPQTPPSDLRWGLNLRHRGVQLPGRARGIVSSIPEMVGGGLSSTNARVITHQHRPLDRSNFNLQLNRRMQDIAMTPNVNVPVRRPGGVPVFPRM